jgi:hypothetical protein
MLKIMNVKSMIVLKFLYEKEEECLISEFDVC